MGLYMVSTHAVRRRLGMALVRGICGCAMSGTACGAGQSLMEIEERPDYLAEDWLFISHHS